MYLEALRARLEPERFAIILRVVEGIGEAMAAGAKETILDIPDEQAVLLGNDLVGEVLMVLAICGGQDEDAQIVQAGQVITVAPAQVASDPKQVAQIEAWGEDRLREQQQVQDQLDGIAQASGLS